MPHLIKIKIRTESLLNQKAKGYPAATKTNKKSTLKNVTNGMNDRPKNADPLPCNTSYKSDRKTS
jgi:hypothetical protein